MLFAPWFPGGGRAALYVLIHGALLVGCLVLFPLLRPGHVPDEFDPAASALVLFAYGFLYVGLPTAVFARRTRESFWRSTGRISALALCFGALFLPMIFGLLLGSFQMREFRHPGSPVFVVDELINGGEPVFAALIFVLALAVLVLNAPRILRGVVAMAAASDRRRAVEAERAAYEASRQERSATPAAPGGPDGDDAAPA